MNSSSYTIFAVEGKAAAGNYYFVGTSMGGQNNEGLHFGYRGDTDFTLAQFGNDLDATAPAYSGAEVARTWTGMLNTSSGHYIYLNGTQVASNTNTTGFMNLNPSNDYGIIGAGYGFNDPFVGDLGEVLIYNSALSSAQQAAVQQYLMDKWYGILPTTTPVLLSGGGTLDLNGATQEIGSLSSSDPTTAVTMESGELVVGNNNASTLFAGTINGAGNLVKTGTGTLTLTGNNSYSGATAILGGTLQIGNGGSGASIGSTTSVLDYGTLAFDNADTIQFATAITGTGGVTMSGSGTVVLSGANSLSGPTAISNGTVLLGSPTALGAGNLTVSSGTLDLGGYSVSVGNLAGQSGVITLSGTTNAVLSVNQTSAGAFNGTLTDGPNATLGFTQTGNGLLIFGGIAMLSGSATVSGGELFMNGTMTTPLLTVNGNGQLDGAGTLKGSLLYASAASSNFGGKVLGSETVEVDSGSLTLSGTASNYTGGTFIVGGVLAVGANNALPVATTVTFGSSGTSGTLDLDGHIQQVAGLTINPNATAASQVIGNSSTVSNGTLIYNGPSSSTFAGTIQDTLGSGTQKSAVAVSGGTLVLAGNNSYSGGTTVNGGLLQLQVGTPSALGTGSLAANGGILDLSGNTVTVGGLSGAAGIVTNSNFYAAALIVDQSNTTSFGGKIMNGPNSAVDGNASLSLTMAGPGTLILSGTDTYTNGTTVSGGVLEITQGSALPGGESLAVGAAGTFIFDPTATASSVNLVAAQPAQVAVEAVPEPSTLALFGAAAALLALYRRRSRRAA